MAEVINKVSASAATWSSTVPVPGVVVVSGGRGLRFDVMSLLRPTRRPGLAIIPCGSIARRPYFARIRRFNANRPKR